MKKSVLIALFVLASCSKGPDVVDEKRLASASQDEGNWLMYGRTYEDHRTSPLRQINEESIGKLGLAWNRELGTTRGLQATPLVKDGVIYTTGSWSVVYAMDARSGSVLWTHDPKVSREKSYFYCCDVVNRGVAIYQGRVYAGTLDGRLIALDEKTGALAWSVDTTENGRPYSITSAPRIARGKVVIGNGGAEFGVRGYISAYDAATGKMVWRSYTVPGDPSRPAESPAMAAAAKTWSGEYWKTGGGGTAWEGIVYDPDLDLLYFGTGNPTAWYRPLRGQGGDALYTASILAVRGDTGEIAWHFQTTPSDSFDYDATQPLVQAELPVNGTRRKVIMQANKNGFFYVLDRKTGEFLSGAPFVSGISWAKGLDAKGRPIEMPGVAEMKPVLVSPSPQGAHNWNPMAFDAATNVMYLPVKDNTQMVHAPNPNWKYNPDDVNLGLDDSYNGPLYGEMMQKPRSVGKLLAWDVVMQKEVWSAPYSTEEGGGVLLAGGLVFQGRGDGILAAYRAADGKPVWQFDAGTGIMAPPVTYLVDGVQYLTVMAGWGGPAGLLNMPQAGPMKHGFGRVLTFRIGGDAKFRPLPYGHTEPPKPAMPLPTSKKEIAQGEVLYNGKCVICHGLNAVAGPVPDLRYSTKETLEQYEEIVLRGSRISGGMPSFAKLLKPDEVRAIRAFVLARAHEAAKPAAVGQMKR